MEILVTIVAFWLILVGAYGVYTLVAERSQEEEREPRPRKERPQRRPAVPQNADSPFAPPARPAETVPSFITRVQALPRPEPQRPVSFIEPRRGEVAPADAMNSEVDYLRAQVEHLRSEVFALSRNNPERGERPQQRRYRTGNYTHLPPTLRRQVNEARGFRRFLRI